MTFHEIDWSEIYEASTTNNAFLVSHERYTRAVMHAGMANWRFPLKSMAGKTFPAFPAHAERAI